MSKNYNDCCIEVGLDPSEKEAPKQEKIWYAYSEGKVIRCDKIEDAKKYKLYETVLDPDSKLRIQQWWDRKNELEVKAVSIFKESLREDYAEMSDKMFDLCYIAADEKRGRSVDYDEIPDNFRYFAMFAHKVLEISKDDMVNIAQSDSIEELAHTEESPIQDSPFSMVENLHTNSVEK